MRRLPNEQNEKKIQREKKQQRITNREKTTNNPNEPDFS